MGRRAEATAPAASLPPLRPNGQPGGQPVQPERAVQAQNQQVNIPQGKRHFGGGSPPVPPAQAQEAGVRASDEGPPAGAKKRPWNQAQQQQQKGQIQRAFQVTNSQMRKNNSNGFWQRLKQKKGGGKGTKR